MSRLNPRQATETATVTPTAGRNASGPTLGTPQDVRVAYSPRQSLVRSRDGAEVLSTARLLASPETNPGVDLEALFVPLAAVTVRGRDYQVIVAEPALNRGRLVYVAVSIG